MFRKLLHFKPTLQTRILFLTIVIATVVLLVSDNLSKLSSVRALEKEIGSQTTMAAHRMALDLMHATPENIDRRFHQSLSKVLEVVPNILRVDVYAKYGQDLRLVISSMQPEERPLEDFELQALNSGDSDTYMVEDEGSFRRVVAVNPLHLLDGKPAFVTVVSSLKPVDDLMKVRSQIRFFTLLANIVLLVIAITLLFRTTVYRSISHLVKTMHLFLAGQTTIRAQDRLPGEFGELARHLNFMLQEISQFHDNMKQQIQAATDVLAKRNQELENLNLLLFETQKQLVQAERLALVGQLTATFAHEVGSPLSALSTHLQILLEDSRIEPSAQERLKMADAEINRVVGIVENLLTNARRTGHQAPVDIGETIRKVHHLLGPLLQSRQVELTLTSEPGQLLIQAHSDQLQQLFLNLFNNSLDAIQKTPGRIGVRIRRVTEPPHDRPFFEIRIEDSGVGISADKLEHIFEPFFTTKEFGKGTGLGLAVCQEIVRRHDGRILAQSTPGENAIFTIYFPEYIPDPDNDMRSPAQEAEIQ
jgi:signal transduction histidine kinase